MKNLIISLWRVLNNVCGALGVHKVHSLWYVGRSRIVAQSCESQTFREIETMYLGHLMYEAGQSRQSIWRARQMTDMVTWLHYILHSLKSRTLIDCRASGQCRLRTHEQQALLPSIILATDMEFFSHRQAIQCRDVMTSCCCWDLVCVELASM